VEYARFQAAVLDLAGEGARLTAAAVAARLKVEPATAGKLLDRMARDGQLDLDVDARSGEIFYTVDSRAGRRPAPSEARAEVTMGPQAAPNPGALARAHPPASAEASGLSDKLREIGASLDGDKLAVKVGAAMVLDKLGLAGKGEGPLPLAKQRKVPLGVLLGGLLPGFGLAYAAPWPIVVAASAVVLVGLKVLALIPFVSFFLTASFFVLCAVTSAILGGLYTWQYNQVGKRAPLGDEPISPKQLIARIRK
jgi:hypothetical protein